VDTVFDILQALGIAAAIGIRPFLPTLLVGALAAVDAGIDFDGTDWSFLESPVFLLIVLVLLVLFDVVRRRVGDERVEATTGGAMLAGFLAAVFGAMLGGGSLADHGGPVVVGVVIGVLVAPATLIAVMPLFARVRKRLDAGAAALLPVYREAAGLVAAGLSVLFPPLAILVLGGVAWLAAGGRRREGEKYAGLRILR
jgi:hypothetical protein